MLIKSDKFRLGMFSGFERIKLKKEVKHKMACCVANKYRIKKVTYFGNELVDICQMSNHINHVSAASSFKDIHEKFFPPNS